jgi:hypothetical protein
MIVGTLINGTLTNKQEYPEVSIVHAHFGMAQVFGPNRNGRGGAVVYLTKEELEQALTRLRELPENTK